MIQHPPLTSGDLGNEQHPPSESRIARIAIAPRISPDSRDKLDRPAVAMHRFDSLFAPSPRSPTLLALPWYLVHMGVHVFRTVYVYFP
jgi:hypothetical protein